MKRIHEYKRQHLNVLNIVTQYRRLKQNSDLQIPPRAFIFGGKAAPGYFMAKRIIKLINAVGETVNADNFFLFGLSVEEVERIKRDGYRPSYYIDGNSELAAVLDLIAGGAFADGDTEVFRPLVDNLRYDDPFLVLADYMAYVSCQQQVSAAWQDTAAWTRMSILNTARSRKFSSDRAITEYCDDIWNVWPVTVTR